MVVILGVAHWFIAISTFSIMFSTSSDLKYPFVEKRLHLCLCSPHIQTIRERISMGRFGEPVSAKALRSLFHRIKKILDRAMEVENGRMSHFEVSTYICHCWLLFN